MAKSVRRRNSGRRRNSSRRRNSVRRQNSGRRRNSVRRRNSGRRRNKIIHKGGAFLFNKQHIWIDDPNVPVAQARAYGGTSYKVCSVSGCRAIQSTDDIYARGMGSTCPWSWPVTPPPAVGEHHWTPSSPHSGNQYDICSVPECEARKGDHLGHPELSRGAGSWRCPWSLPAPGRPRAGVHADVVKGRDASLECERRYNSGKGGTPAGIYHTMAGGEYQDVFVLCKTCNKVGITIEELNRLSCVS